MPTCGRCGTDNVGDARFCRACGATLSASTAKVDIGEVLREAERGREEAEARARALETELAAQRQQRVAALGERDALAAELDAARLKLRELEHAPGAAAAGGGEELRRALDSLAESKARVADLERRLGADQTKRPPSGTRRRWLLLAAAVLAVLLGALGVVDGLRSRSQRAWLGNQAARLRDELRAAGEREQRLRHEVARLSEGTEKPAPVPAPGGDLQGREAKLQRAEQLTARREEELTTRERELAEGQKRLERERGDLAGLRNDIKAAEARLQRERSAAAKPPASGAAVTAKALEGYVLWQGRVQQPTSVVINGDWTNFGVISGAFPGRSCDIREVASIHASVRARPGARNRWQQARIEPEPGRLATVLFVWSCQ